METEQRWTSSVVRRSPYLAGATILLPLATAAGWSSLILVVLGHVIPAWVVSTSLLVISMILIGVHRVRQLYAADDRAPVPRLGLPRFVLGLLVAAAGLGSAFGAVSDLTGGADYRILQPAGPDGCVAVVRETSFLKISNGEVYAVGRTGVAWRPSGSWVADDIYRPVAEGTYELRWSGSSGMLAVSGSATDPIVASELNPLECG
ncbi:hypothetical protein [Streptomyces sp. HB132]|uniref:hypothetical protein n=1 Tax=Streptomyces sp. HB132 TaxID=767388 RepID=UPI00196040AE|nr:hypothetical protein [Streptomyces sp. HB132]MBM7436640.1 hypothetical protein [Streptomyces sp. HB132]